MYHKEWDDITHLPHDKCEDNRLLPLTIQVDGHALIDLRWPETYMPKHM